MIDDDVWEGVRSLLDNYIEVRNDDTCLIIYASNSREAAAWVSVALECRSIRVQSMWMHPIRDDGFASRLKAALPPERDLPGRLVVLTLERDTMSHTNLLRTLLAEYNKTNYVVVRAISVTPALYSGALHAHPHKLSDRNAVVLDYCMSSKEIRVQTPSGTDLSIILDSSRHRWISNRGVSRPGSFVILPAGEVATFPASIEGILVADFAFNVNAITDRDARLHECPVRVIITNGRAVKYECDDLELMAYLDTCFAKHCASNVGEIGFGTNWKVDTAIPLNSHINERRPGVHLGFGQHNQSVKLVGYDCNIHLDLITKGGTITATGREPLDLEALDGLTSCHPSNLNEEDVYSPGVCELEVDDCCGVLTGGTLRPFTSSSVVPKNH